MDAETKTDVFKRTVSLARGTAVSVAVISLFVNLLMLTVPFYMLQLFDRVLASRSVDTLLYLTIAAVGALTVMGALDALRSRILARTSTWLEQRLGPGVLERAISSKLIARDYGTQALRDLTQVRQFFASPGLLTLFDTPWVPVYLAVVFLMHPALGMVGLVGAIALFLIAIVNELITRKPLAEANDRWLRALGNTDAAVRNAEVIEAMGMMPGITRRWYADNQQALALQQKASDRSGLLIASSKALRLTLQVAMLGTGAYLVVQQQITGGIMIAGSIILGRALQPVEQAVGTWKTLVSARTAYKRLASFLSSTPQRKTDIALPAPQGHLQVERVAFVPPGGEKPTLKGVSFTLNPGEILGVVGPSAAGKSTLARLLVGAWKPTSGVVRLDGGDLCAWNRAAIGRHVGYVPQDVELFDGTVAQNIARFSAGDSGAIVEAAKQAGIHDMLLRLPYGYSTVIGDGGAKISGGQRQRIALARALYGSPRLIVLDEPNANLDSEGEEALLKAMEETSKIGATVVFISHRPSLVSCADKILYLRGGIAEMLGPQAEVMCRLTQPSSAPREPGRSQLTRVGRG